MTETALGDESRLTGGHQFSRKRLRVNGLRRLARRRALLSDDDRTAPSQQEQQEKITAMFHESNTLPQKLWHAPTMHLRKFEPKFMKIGVLTAALQELTPRKLRDQD